MESNKIFLVNGEVHGQIFLRMSIGTFTHEEKHIKVAFEHLQKCAGKYMNNIKN